MSEETETGEVLDAIDRERALAVACAREQIGEYTRNSREVRAMIERVIPSLTPGQVSYCLKDSDFHWCGVCALSALHLAKLTDAPWVVCGVTPDPYGVSVGFARGYLPVTTDPKPGDIFIGPPPANHHGIVILRAPDDQGVMKLRSVEGNAGKSATCIEQYRNEPKKLTYYSIEPLIRKKLGL